MAQAKAKNISAAQFVKKLKTLRSPTELKKYHRYFEFDEDKPCRGDQFIGVRMGQVFALAKEFIAMPPDGGAAQLFPQVGLSGILEVFSGGLLLFGMFTPPVAFVLAGEKAVTYFQFHAPQSFWTIINNGQAAVLCCFIWLYFSAAGAGTWSLDAKRGK